MKCLIFGCYTGKRLYHHPTHSQPSGLLLQKWLKSQQQMIKDIFLAHVEHAYHNCSN